MNQRPADTTRPLTWVRAQALWFRDRDDLLGRVLVVCEGARGLLALQAAAVNLAIVLPRSDNVIGVAAATIALLYWQLFLSWRMRRPQQRTLSTHLADLGVTCAIILTTAQVAPEASVLTLAGYWAGGCAAYAAVFRSIRWGVGFALVTAAAMLVDPGGFVGERVGLAFAMVVLSAALALLINQFRATIIQQEQERMRSASLAERERLSRIVHDGALQVLALVEREGASLGPRGLRLAALARESEAQLRSHLQDREVEVAAADTVDLAAALDKYGSARVTVSTMASLVTVPRRLVDEIEATLAEILTNVERHAGPGAQVWILLDQELDDEVILWVRDNGVGMSAGQAQEAADNGRLGIRDSIVGRMAALGGSAILKSSPGAGTEWELRFPLDGPEMEGGA
ncbi:sensor histidine kinase [Tessaracoccus lacteus]|uniref:Histidine kinase/HSP90-like ATPase domain-containing protein n=1 Tax=Tessaracoccus lacteus TaxID=3041766 RepID=A0ABY8Q035_9ACTN|nr:ATP-binding protein [Tessaracoccus sp. T21]WGT48023.1 hypothetical protein QH948_04475 [Tessaracoccus sp. T21]